VDPQLVTIRGSIERVTYHNAENGFCVLRVAIRNKHDPVTVVGNATQVMAGEDVEAVGVWIYDRNHGNQLKANSIKMTVPTSIEGIKKYLASGLIKGIGKHFSNILVNEFKEEVFNILDNEPERVKGLPGIGKKRTEQIIHAWSEQKAIREIMVFLHGHGIGTARAVRIYKTYGEDTVEKLQTNPYCLALDIWGIGFKTADQLAQSIGIDKNSVIRAEAGIRHILNEYSGQGHCAILPQDLIQQCITMLEIESGVIEQGITNELANGNVIKDAINNEAYLYIAPLYYAEQGIASHLHRLSQDPVQIDLTDTKIIALAETDSAISFSESQKLAILMAVKNKVSIITGGPGVGKTTIVKNILKIVSRLGKKITLCAPTGRAAKRLSESSGFEAKTIHRLLEYRPGQGAKYNQGSVIIDAQS
jgi:exodeoxyribonuclease V alpha subunit